MTIAGTVAVGVRDGRARPDLGPPTSRSRRTRSRSRCASRPAVLGMYSGARRAAAARETRAARRGRRGRGAPADRARAARRGRPRRVADGRAGAGARRDRRARARADRRDRRPRPPHDGRAAPHAAGAARRRRTPNAPGAGLADLDELSTRARLRACRSPSRSTARRASSRRGVDQSAYRIVQEAVTNVVKHADRAPTTITLGYGDEALELTIARRGRRLTGDGGHGLVGMRERAELFGGTLDAGPRDGHGFEVRAVLPYR